MNPKTEKKDERENKPSASKGGDYEKCPGKHKLELPFADVTSPEASEGNDIHQWLDDESSIKLTGEALQLAQECKAHREMLLDMLFADRETNPPEIIKEKRLWYRKKRFSGKTDLIALRDKRAAIIDYKCGRIPVPEAHFNAQLRWYTTLLAQNYKVNEVTVCIIQPRCGKPSLYTYDKDGIRNCRHIVLSTLRKMESDNPRLEAGESQCRYCKAKSVCPELSRRDLVVTTLRDAHELSPQYLSEALALVPLVEARCKEIKEQAKNLLLEDEAALPGYTLKEGNIKRTVSSVTDVMVKVIEAGLMNHQQFTNCCSVSIPKLQARIAKKHDCSSAEAKRILAELLGDMLTEKQQAPSVKKVDE